MFLQWLSYGTGFSDRSSRISAAIAAPYGVVATAWSYWRGGRLFARTIEWLAAGREPTPAERAATLAQPARLAVLFFEPWAGAAVLYGGLNAVVFHPSVVRSLQVAATTLLGGLTTCMVFFLVVERRLRPVFALALAGAPPARPATIGIRPRLLLSWALGSGVVLTGLVLLPLAPVRHGPSHLVGATVFLAVAGRASGFVLTVMAARSVADPIGQDARDRHGGGERERLHPPTGRQRVPDREEGAKGDHPSDERHAGPRGPHGTRRHGEGGPGRGHR